MRPLILTAAALALSLAACDRDDAVPPPAENITATTVRTAPEGAAPVAPNTAPGANPGMRNQAAADPSNLGTRNPGAPTAGDPGTMAPGAVVGTPPTEPIEPVAGNIPQGETAERAQLFEKRMNKVLDHYLAVQSALADDRLDAAKEAADKLSEVADEIEDDGDPEHRKLFESIEAHADNLEEADDLQKARAAFKALTQPMETWAKVAAPAGIDTVHCAMADGRWLQRTGDIKNPYHGKEMLACGDVVAGPGMKK